MATAYGGFLSLPAASSCRMKRKSKVRKRPTSCSLDCAPSTSSPIDYNGSTSEQSDNTRKFSYSRASPSVRWPNMKTETHQVPQIHSKFPPLSPSRDSADAGTSENIQEFLVKDEAGGIEDGDDGVGKFEVNDESLESLGRPSKTKAKKMTKLALKRAKDWRRRVQILTDRILGLRPEEFVADVLDERLVQMTPTDFCFVVKWVGQSSWQRALEVYEWLNLRHWYSPNARMLGTMLSVLGKANEEALAVEIFMRAEPAVGNNVQVYNAMMGVYARNGRFSKVQELLNLMRKQGCEPDLVSFNTLINARLRSGPLVPNITIELLNEVRRSGLRPDIITYNTLISACSRDSNLQEAIKVYGDLEAHKCQPDLWTYNAMISVFGRCGLAGKAERLLGELESKGFLPDAVTYNSLLYAFAREGNIEKVENICEEMVKQGFAKDEMTYNTIIHMYGREGLHDLAMQLYRDMKMSGRIPDAVTYTVLIDSLGKANKMTEAAIVMSEMLDSGVKPTIRTFSALICGYGKAGMRTEAEESYDCMLRSGIKPDSLAYSVMMDIFLRSNDSRKAEALYQKMVNDGFLPDDDLYMRLVRVLKMDNKEDRLRTVIVDMEELCGMNPLDISSVLVRGECYDAAADMLRLAVKKGYDLDHKNLLVILSSYSSSGRHHEAQDLLKYLEEAVPASSQLVDEALVVVLCSANQPDEALKKYHEFRNFEFLGGSDVMYKSLIKCCNESELLADASQIFSDMRFCGFQPSQELYQCMVHIYCNMNFPETAQMLIDEAECRGIKFTDPGVYVSLIDAYGGLKKLPEAESVVGQLRQKCKVVERKVWNGLIQAYAAHGCYEQARAAFHTMMRDGPSPTVDTINALMQSLIVDGRLNELYVLVQELQDMGFVISKSTIVLMLEAFVRVGNIFEVKKLYNGMKAAGYLPSMHMYRIMIGLLSKGKQVRDTEAMVSEMEESQFKPDLPILNSLLKMYTDIEKYREAAAVYQTIQKAGFEPDENTYSSLILMYCRDCRPEEGLMLMNEMQKRGLDPKLETYKSLIAACAKQQLIEKAEGLFHELHSTGYKLDRSFYHILIKMYRDSGCHKKAEGLLVLMKDSGVEPSIGTMHLMMMLYGRAGQPMEAEKVLQNLKSTGLSLSTLPYSSVIDAYLKNGEYNAGTQKLVEMKNDGFDPDHRIWTCFIRAASLCHSSKEALNLLKALQYSGFDLPMRLLTESSEALVLDVDNCLENLAPLEDNAAFNFVNALEDLLWAFEFRATASWVFQIAVRRKVYRHDVFRVAEKDWGADFRKLSAGAALVGLTLWLDCMQDASLEGSPESPKSVVLITGGAEYNMVSLNSTLKAFLWEMGSPFLPCKTRTGVLVAKAHSLRMWLKDSPFCFDLELRNSPSFPDSNSMQLIEGCFIRRGLVPAFKDITERLGVVRPKKFSRLALLPDSKRSKVIEADILGRKEKLETMKKRAGLVMKKKSMTYHRRKFVRRARLPNPK